MSNTRILLVEDDTSVAESIQVSLRSLGYTVSAIAASKEEALQQVAKTLPDLVLLDIHLEEAMDGVEAADQIHARFDIPVVYLTGYDDDDTLQQAKTTEPFGYLLKPFNIRELHATIEIALYKHAIDKKLQASEARFRSIVQDQTELIWRYLPDGTLTFVNEACRWYFGQEPEELVGQCFFRFVPEEDQQEVRNLIASLRTGNPVVETEHRIILSERTIRWHHWTNRIICDNHGNIIDYQGTGRDITERKQMEEELRLYREHLEELVEKRTAELTKTNEQLQQEIVERKRMEKILAEEHNLLQTLLDNLPDYIYVKDRKSRFLLANKASMRGLGVTTQEELVGKTDFDFFPPELSEQYFADEQTIFESGHPLINREERNVDLMTGVTNWLLTTKVLLRDSQGNILGIVGISRDITKHKIAEEALRESEERFRTIFETARDSIFIKDCTLRYIQVNPAMETLFSAAAAELIGRTDEDLFGKKVGVHIRKVDSRVLHGEIVEEEHTKPVKGKSKTFHVIKVPMYDRSGEIIGLCGIARDITERKHAEQALQTSEEQYRVLAESVADGIAIVQEGKFVFVNKALCSMLDYTSEQLLSMYPADPLRDDYKESGREERKLLEKGDTDQTWQIPCVTGDGREIWIETHRGVIEWEGKSALLVTVRDITERKLREIAIEEEKNYLKHINIALKSTMKDRYKFGDLVGKSPVMQAIYEFIVKASAADVNVVIYGESGTGKELIAQTIHQMSKRHEKAFVPVNCGAIPDMLFEREFFGHQKGAFTGAYADKPGFFDLAHNGTLFLDEVSEIPPHMQVKLLRALEDGEYIPVGSNTVQKADARIIAATNRDLEDLIQQGLIREDIFYRIQVLAITVPPLRDRREDIPLLIDHFLTHFGYDKTQHVLPGDVLEKLYTYHWPGNIRELQNVLRRYLTIGRLDFRSAHKTEPDKKDDGVTEEFSQESPRLREAVEAFEKRFIIDTLKRHHWHKGKAAMALDIPRRTLHRKLKKLGVK